MSIIGQVKVNVEWKPQCACVTDEPPSGLVELVDGSSVGTATGVEFRARYHARVCAVCKTPHRMALATYPRTQPDRRIGERRCRDSAELDRGRRNGERRQS